MKHSKIAVSAGQLATELVPTIVSNQTVGSALQYLSKQKNIETYNYVYVINQNRHLVGVVSLKELYKADNILLINKIMNRKLITARPTTKAEKVAYLALKHNIKSVPIVDKNSVFQGVIASDTILETLYQNMQSDLLHISGIIPNKSTLTSFSPITIWQSLKSRLPWIGIGLLGGTVIAQFMNHFENALVAEVLFVPFIPMVVYIANAVGVQSQTLYIREETINQSINTWQFLKRQLIEGIAIGLLTWLSMILLTTVLWSKVQLGAIVGFAMLLSLIVSTIQAVLIPYFLIKLKCDPAIGSGPFATILQDFTSVAIFIFSIVLLI